MRTLLSLLLTATGAIPAATLRGAVVENLTGHPLARASILLEPVPGSSGVRMTGHTNRYGLFEFSSTAPGLYILQATRVPFVTAYYGQKRWNSAGMPLNVTDSETQFVTIRMMRFAAIGGTVVDENDVGQPGIEVSAYRNTRPLQLIAHAAADERGVYRIYGLLPESYLVRSMGKEIEGTGYKPTFAHETESVDEARQVDVDVEQEAREVKLRALPGQLFALTVTVKTLLPMDVPVTLTLVSEMGRQVAVTSKSHIFTGLPRGDYEIFAEAPSETPGVKQGAYQRISLARNDVVDLVLRKMDPVRFDFAGLPLKAADDGTVKLLGRRKDLAGSHDTQAIQLSDHYAALTVGPWEFAVVPIDGYYVSGFSGSSGYRNLKRFDGWNEQTIQSWGGFVRFSFSNSPAALHGTVTDTGDPAVGAPVFLEPVDLEPARRITDTYVTITDVHGRYNFGNLAPGHYRVLSSFEYQMPDSKIMTEARARELQVDVRSDLGLDLDLYVIR
jgi:hypothetical protein